MEDLNSHMANGKIKSQEAEWIEVKPKCKQFSKIQQGKSSVKLDKGHYYGKPTSQFASMVSPMGFLANPNWKDRPLTTCVCRTLLLTGSGPVRPALLSVKLLPFLRIINHMVSIRMTISDTWTAALLFQPLIATWSLCY